MLESKHFSDDLWLGDRFILVSMMDRKRLDFIVRTIYIDQVQNSKVLKNLLFANSVLNLSLFS